ncbi:hypothetical protein [Endozoicomonas sp. ONNA2]|uniref:hypothetical protein n=1 Tax=Endozoicomonas sp. ONNA2 TaxID=2828741 RepID=UPI0021478E5E|nr:hypothetical protein [Endozoicomonas sp. ONNA2]
MKHIKIDDQLFTRLQALFEAHQASDSVSHYDDVRDMIYHILHRVASANGASMGSQAAALLNILNIEGES